MRKILLSTLIFSASVVVAFVTSNITAKLGNAEPRVSDTVDVYNEVDPVKSDADRENGESNIRKFLEMHQQMYEMRQQMHETQRQMITILEKEIDNYPDPCLTMLIPGCIDKDDRNIYQ